MSQTYTDDFVTGQGGVFTEEVGVVTGEVTLRTTVADGGAVTVAVRYRGADEWYTVSGGHATLHDERDGRPLHDLVLGVLRREDEGAAS